MIPKLHAKGTSFLGAARYVLHDKDRADTAERVEWTQTRNVAVEDPHMAAKIMAATAMDADRLKAEAGVSKAGRRSNKTVLHMTLSWHPDETETLSPEEMKRAAYGAIRALGAEDRQALIVAHNDEEQPHLHIVLNRVSAEDGRMLSSSKEKLKLSKWAQAYEEERGHIYCDERVVNNAARDRGEYTRAEPDAPRHVHELETANDNSPEPSDRRRAKDVRKAQREKDRAAGLRSRELRIKQAEEWKQLAAEQKQHRQDARETIRRAAAIARQQVRDSYRDKWRERHLENKLEREDFDGNEASFTGRMKNRMKTIDFKSMVSGENKGRAIKEGFGAFAAAGARSEQFKRQQEERDNALKARQETEARKAARSAREAQVEQHRRMWEKFAADRAELILRQAMEQARMRAEWRQRSIERKAEWEKHREQAKANAAKQQEAKREQQQQPRPAPIKIGEAVQQSEPLKPRFEQANQDTTNTPPPDDEKARQYRAFLDKLHGDQERIDREGLPDHDRDRE